MMQSRLEERIIRSRSAIAKLSQRAEELQLEKLGINPNMSTTSNPRPSPTINTEYIPRISKPEFSDEEAARKKLEARLAQISQLSQQTHASFPLQAQARTEVSARAEGNFIFVSEWDTSQTFMKDPAFTPRPPASPELQRDEQILSMSGDNSYDRSPQQSQAPTNVNFFRSVPGASEPRFYKGMIKPVEVFRGNPEVQKMYKTTTERLKESYAQVSSELPFTRWHCYLFLSFFLFQRRSSFLATMLTFVAASQEVAASLPRGAQSTADRMVGWHVALQVGLRVVAAASDHEESRGGAGMISRVDEEEHRCISTG